MATSMTTSKAPRIGELGRNIHSAGLLARDIPYRAMLTEHDVLTWQGTLMRLWRLDGLHAPTLQGADAQPQSTALAAPLHLPGAGDFAVWLHRVEHAATECQREPDSEDSGNEYTTYLSLVFRPAWSVTSFLRTLTHASAREIYARYLPTMEAASAALEQQLPGLEMHLLGDYFPNGQHCNEVFDFLAYSLTSIWESRPLVAGPLDRALQLQEREDEQKRRVPTLQLRRTLHPFPELVAGQQLYDQALGIGH